MKRFSRSFRPEDTEHAGIMPWTFQRITARGEQTVDGGVVIEESLEIRLNDRSVAVLMRTPGMEKELAAGFCLGEGLVRSLEDIALVRHCGHAVASETAEQDALDISRNRVDVLLMSDAREGVKPPDAVQLIRSGCGRMDVQALMQDLSPVNGNLQVRSEILPGLLGQITSQQEAYRAAGGIHAAAMFDNQGRVIVVCEDIGRHNAVDKVVGYCLLRGISVRDKMLVSTGRASYDMISKAVRMGIPVVVSISSPTSLAVELAEAMNCTLLGYLRGKALNIYTHGWRVVSAPL